ncbi:MAG: hypothetical protein IJG84_11535 [Kiritimatiellae bacterium]|nr:hypothetical protein [Kiritimatiellia bacterium]
MRHIKNYKQARSIMVEHFRKECQRIGADLALYESCFGNPKCWDETCKRYRIKRPRQSLSEGGIVTEADVKRLRDHLEKWIPKQMSLWGAKLEAADRAGKLIELNMCINWGRQRNGCGHPRCEAWLFFEDKEYGSRSAYGVGTAGGCGYDLRSAAMQDALGFNTKKGDCAEERIAKSMARASLDRFVIEHGEALWSEYAIEMTPFPHLSISAKGSNVFTNLFRKIGCKPYREFPVNDYLLDCRETDRGSDVYHLIRKDRI